MATGVDEKKEDGEAHALAGVQDEGVVESAMEKEEALTAGLQDDQLIRQAEQEVLAETEEAETDVVGEGETKQTNSEKDAPDAGEQQHVPEAKQDIKTAADGKSEAKEQEPPTATAAAEQPSHQAEQPTEEEAPINCDSVDETAPETPSAVEVDPTE